MKKLIIVLVFLVCGCANYKELNDIAIVTGISIDKDDNYYIVNTSINNIQNSQSNYDNSSQIILYEGRGKTISESLKSISLKLSKELYLGHLTVIVISEDIGKQGIDNISEYFFRISKTTKRFNLIQAKNSKASDILSIISPLESFSSKNIINKIQKNYGNQDISSNVTYSEFIEKELKKGIEPILPTITIEEDVKESINNNLSNLKKESNIKLSSMALYKDDNFVGYSTKEESKGINILNNKINKTIITTIYNDKKITNNIYNIKVKRNIYFKNNKPIVKIKIEAKSSIVEAICDIDLNNKKELKKLKKEIIKEIENITNKSINLAKYYKTDIFGFGNLVYKKNYDFYNKVKNWNDYFSKLDIDIDVDLKIVSSGSIKKTIKEAKNED